MNETWFPLDRKSDLENVLNFLDRLPDNFFKFIDDNNSNFIRTYLKPEDDKGLTGTLLVEAFEEAKEELTSALKLKRRRINIDSIIGDNTEARIAAEELRSIGFTGSSLKLKATLLNKFWKEIIDQVGQGIMNFADNKLVKLVRKFLNLLNSMLASLKLFLPQLDGLKEIKEILENYLTFAEKE